MSVAVSVRSLYKRFGAFAAVDDVSFEVPTGSTFTLLGPSGCGKTTTLRCIAGLDDPSGGSIEIDGRVVVEPSRGLNVPPEKRDLGMMFQSYAVWPHMTVFDNVAFGLRLRRVQRKQLRDQVQRTLQVVGLEGLEGRRPSQLSGGQQQRVALARALAYRPTTLLMDEPLSNLDALLRERMRVELRTLQRELGITMIYVTHDQVEALVISDQIAVMDAGKVVQQGTPQEIYMRPATPFVAGFVGRNNLLDGKVEAIGHDSAVVVTSSGLRLRSATGSTLSPGCPVLICLRPETLRLRPSGQPDSRSETPAVNFILGRRTHSMFAGQYVEHLVDCQGAVLIVHDGESTSFSGDEVELRIDPKDVIVIDKGASNDCTAAR